jgi:nucleoid-associated protein YgaU
LFFTQRIAKCPLDQQKINSSYFDGCPMSRMEAILMDHSRFLKLKTGAFLLALIMMSACSSSQVDDPAAPPETAGDVAAAPDAKTDSVPVAEDAALAQQPAPGALDASAAAPVADAGAPPPAGDPSVAAAALDAPPGGDPMVAANAETPPALPTTPVSDVPSTPAMDPTVADLTPPAADMYAPVASSAPAMDSGEGVHYKVKHGDTLMKIAFENYGDLYRWKEIYESNRAQITDPNHVPPGTQLTLNGAGMVTIERNGDRYLIKHGDTLGVISNDVYGTTHKWKKLWENNRQLIKDPNKIYAGFFLYYHPEARLTHDDGATDGGSAANMPQNLPFKNQAVAPVNTAVNAALVPVVAPAASGVRAPASK